MVKSALIIGSGEVRNTGLLKKEALKHDFVICADGGIKHTYDLDINVDLVVGDLDSVDERFDAFVNEHKISIEKYPTEKDATDIELAIDYAVKNSYKMITLMGVSGGRIDHTLANIFLLKSIVNSDIKARIVDEKNIVYYTEDILKLTKRPGFYVSLIPLSKEGIVVTLDGFYYTLKRNHIPFGSTHGISNYVVDNEGVIIIHKGCALVIESKD